MTALLDAILSGDAATAAHLVSGADRNARAEGIRLACERADEQMFDAIIDGVMEKASYALPDALRAAVRAGHPMLVDKLVKRGARDREWRGTTACDATLVGNMRILRALDLANGVWDPKQIEEFREWPSEPPTAPEDGNWTLFNAIRTGDEEVLRFVLGKGLDVNRTTHAGRSPLEMAEALELTNIAGLLKEAGAVPFDRQTVNFNEAVFYGFDKEFDALLGEVDETHRGYAFRTAAYRGHMRLIHALAPYAEPKQLVEGLGSAAARGNLPALQAMLSLGAKVNGKDSLGLTPLLWAASKNHVPAMRALVKAGAKLDAKGGDRQTALQTAVSEGRVEAAAFLLEAGANPNTVAGDGSTPRSLAESSPHRDVFVPMIEAAGGRADLRKELLKGMKKKLAKAKRKAFRLEQTEASSLLGTRFGGQPFLTAKHARPTGETPLALLLQIDLRAAPDKKQQQDALLQVFDAPGEHPPIRARLVPCPDESESTPDNGPALLEMALGFSRTKTDLPARADETEIALDENEEPLLPFLNLGGDKIFGWPDWIQDVDRREGERLLLQLVGGGLTRRDFGDAGNVFVFEGPEGLRITGQSY